MKKEMWLIAWILLITGVIVFLYPPVSNYLAERQQKKVIVGYQDKISGKEESQIQKEWKKARDYKKNPNTYMDVLNVDGNGVMGYIEIPKIDVRVPIYHNATEESLSKGAGHVKETDLPIGGNGNFTVITGHRGLPGNELFTRLDEMSVGDLFSIYVLDEELTYKVYQIRTVSPEEVSLLQAQKNRDLVTLVTCTPYGVNTHRLLIEAERWNEPTDMVGEHKEEGLKRNKIIYYIIILLSGVAILVYPYMSNRTYIKNVKKQKNSFVKECLNAESRLEGLYEKLQKENEKLYINGQNTLIDENTYSAPGIDLSIYDIDNNTIAYITIPRMKITLPILLGASEENMKHGAVHMTGTSYPVGGKNTNCVIAAHRGYSKREMFRNIENLTKGDKVYIRNFRNRLVYTVVENKVIKPDDAESILIQEGKDMITLMTCHPYRKNSHRYVVFCKRVM